MDEGVSPAVILEEGLLSGMSVMGSMRDVIKEAKSRGIREKVKIMIGGAPVTQSFCSSIGADCYTSDAASAAEAAYAFCKK